MLGRNKDLEKYIGTYDKDIDGREVICLNIYPKKEASL